MTLSLRILGALVVALSATGCATGPTPGTDFTPETGDLLFQDSDGGDFATAIEKVTHGVDGAEFTHVGIAMQGDDGRVEVVEATSKGVIVTPLDKFLAKSHDAQGRPKVLVGRLKPEYRGLIGPALDEALALRGKPYDSVFDIENDAYYCSELVYIAFLRANGGEPIFQLEPMTFVDPDTGETFGLWEDYYEKLGAPIPEGEPGLNPGGISRSPAIDIVHAYGRPDGWRKQI